MGVIDTEDISSYLCDGYKRQDLQYVSDYVMSWLTNLVAPQYIGFKDIQLLVV